MITKLTMHGISSDAIPEIFDLAVPNIPAAITDIDRAKPGFKQDLLGGEWIFECNGVELTADDIKLPLVGELDVYPVLSGAKTSQQEKANIIGGVLLATAFFTAGAGFIVGGTFTSSLLFNGAILAFTYGYTMGLTPDDPATSDGSDTINGAGVSNEGAVIPVLYGELRVSGVRVSLEIENYRRGFEN